MYKILYAFLDPADPPMTDWKDIGDITQLEPNEHFEFYNTYVFLRHFNLLFMQANGKLRNLSFEKIHQHYICIYIYIDTPLEQIPRMSYVLEPARAEWVDQLIFGAKIGSFSRSNC
jgi:hypothetical protein